MKKFSIADLERLSGVKAHTFRMWEHRYDFLKPERTDTRIRYYTLNELKRVLNISLLNGSGFRISLLSRMTPVGIADAVNALANDHDKKKRDIHKLIIMMFSSDIEAFEMTLDDCNEHYGAHSTIQEIIIPFMQRIGLSWYKDASGVTHFIVTALRKKIISGIEQLRSLRKIDTTALFFLPKGEHFDLILLYMSYLAARRGVRNLYLGTDISLDNLKGILAEKKPDLVFTYFPPKAIFPAYDFSKYLHDYFPSLILVISGFTDKLFPDAPPSNIKLISHRDMEAYLDSI